MTILVQGQNKYKMFFFILFLSEINGADNNATGKHQYSFMRKDVPYYCDDLYLVSITFHN